MYIKSCPVCGAKQNDPQKKEWKHCPKHRKSVCIDCCVACTYYDKECIGRCRQLLEKYQKRAVAQSTDYYINRAKKILKKAKG